MKNKLRQAFYQHISNNVMSYMSYVNILYEFSNDDIYYGAQRPGQSLESRIIHCNVLEL